MSPNLKIAEAKADSWWEHLNNEERKVYVQAHPKYKYARDWYRQPQNSPRATTQTVKKYRRAA
jgi:hypothetical protein